MVQSYEDLHFRVYSWMKVNLMTDYKVLLAIDNIQLGAYVSDLFSGLQELKQMSDDIVDIAVYMPRTQRVVSLNSYYDGTISPEANERLTVYKSAKRSFLHLQDAYRLQSVLNSSSTREPLYIAEITFSDDLLLDHMNEHGEEKYAMISGDGHILCETEDAPLLEAAKSRFWRRTLRRESSF